MVFLLISLVLLVYSLFNFKKAFFAYMVFEIFWYPNAKIINLSGVPSIPLFLFTSILFFVVYLFKRNSLNGITGNKFPIAVPMILLVISRFATCFNSLEGFSSEFFRSIGYLFFNVIEIYLIWKLVSSKEDFYTLIKMLIFMMFIAGLYGLLEYYVLQDNPLVSYKSTFSSGIELYYSGSDSLRGYRLMSCFEHPIGAGMTFGLGAFSCLLLLINKKANHHKVFVFITLIICTLCVFLTKMRSSMFFTIICLIGLIDFKNPKIRKLVIFGSIAAVLCLPLYINKIDILASIFDSSLREKVGGSSISMRMEQLKASIEVLKTSPIVGLGSQVLEYLDVKQLSQLRGLESFVFEEMCRYGLLGLVSTLVLLVYTTFYLPIKYHSKMLFFISLAYWATYALSSIPSLRMNFFYLLMFYSIKSSEAFKLQLVNNNVVRRTIIIKNINEESIKLEGV